ncbi:MAG: alginate lyase family protein [Bacteroidales bacterium]
MKQNKIFWAFLFSALILSSCTKNKEIISILYDDELLKSAKQAIEAKDSSIMPAYAQLKNYTDSVCINMEPLSVVTDKKRLAPSKDPRDYITLSPYWWPDTLVEGGVPYIRRDGERNPEVYEYPERANSTIFAEAVQSLAVMYYLSNDEKYAKKAAEMLRVWFLDPITGMNPNMTYSQTVPGMIEIRGTGIIDARRIAGALNAAKIIEGSDSWTDENKAELKDWANSFRYWLEHSVNGLKEAEAQNNHGMWYEVTHEAVVMYGGDYEYLRKIILEKQLPRIDLQMQPDGSLPRELERTLGLHYSTFALEALNLSDIMAGKIGLNLWEYKAKNGRSMLLGLEYLKPFWKSSDKWPHMQINPFNKERGALLLYCAGKRTNNKEYIELSNSIGYYPDINEKENTNSIPRVNSILYYKIN